MRKFKFIFASRFKTVMIFKFAAISGVITQIFFSFFKIFIIYSFMSGNIDKSPMEIKSTITYIWLTQIFLSIIPWNVNWEELNSIKSGNIVYEMARPISLYSLMFSKTLAWRVANSLVRVIPIFIFNLLVLPLFGLGVYSVSAVSINAILLFIISILIAYFLSTMITVFLYSITLYTIDASNFIGVINSIALLLCGTIIPLSYFPDKLQLFLRFQPFKGIIDTPAMILSGEYSTDVSVFYIAVQAAWVVVFFFINKKMFGAGIKKIVVQGG